MGYLKSIGSFFIYVGAFLAVITFLPGLPPDVNLTEYSVKQPVALTGKLGVNDRLNGAEILFQGKIKGPEAFDSFNGELYTSTRDGYVGKITDKGVTPVAKFGKDCSEPWKEQSCGRPLGLRFNKKGELFVADAFYGIFKVDVKTGKHERLVDLSQPIDGVTPKLANSLDVASNGDIYWTDSSTEFSLSDGAYTALGNPTGRLIRYNAATKKNEVFLKNLGFANGLKLSDDESFVVVVELLQSRLIKYHLRGPKKGQSEVFVDALPGLPDNIEPDTQGGFLVSLVIGANEDNPQILQSLMPHPLLRKMLMRLLGVLELPFKLLQECYPNEFAERAIHAIGSFETMPPMGLEIVTVLRIDRNGKIVDALYATDEKIKSISSAYVHNNYLYLGSPWNNYVARVPLSKALPDLAGGQAKRETVGKKEAAPKVETQAKPTAKPSVEAKPTTQSPPPPAKPAQKKATEKDSVKKEAKPSAQATGKDAKKSGNK